MNLSTGEKIAIFVATGVYVALMVALASQLTL
jgi:hypothetical protein